MHENFMKNKGMALQQNNYNLREIERERERERERCRIHWCIALMPDADGAGHRTC